MKMENNVKNMIESLEKQLEMLKNEEDYTVHSFKVWKVKREMRQKLGSSLIREEKNAWNSGFCRSDTCFHNSHDPYEEGNLTYILCKEIGKSQNGNTVYKTKEGFIFEYVFAYDGGYHYNPSAFIREIHELKEKIKD
jgi:hypothetical protein